ncbi:lysis protein [Salmonella enterica]|nr:lysis protein [Salmonella enterica]EAX3609096.1 lysis protein [Salmonella enterica]EGW6282668.1 lysis protein [Salmonella enterica]EGX3935057.1 lysis protein [Salmonella enterica]
MVAAVAVLGFTADHWHSRFTRAEKARKEAVALADTRQKTIDDMKERQRQNAALDAKYTQELADAKAENDALRDDVADGRRRLLVNATCPAMPTGKPTATARVDNAARPRLADSAQRDYFTLKERVTTMQKQLEGAQQYINEQCH